jgi:hypothetical protein
VPHSSPKRRRPLLRDDSSRTALMTFTRVFYVPGSAALEALVPIGGGAISGEHAVRDRVSP